VVYKLPEYRKIDAYTGNCVAIGLRFCISQGTNLLQGFIKSAKVPKKSWFYGRTVLIN